MITLEINNSYSKVIGLSPKQEKDLRNEISYTVDAKAAYFAGGYGPKRRSLVDKKSSFPTGLLLRVTTYLKKCKLVFTVKDLRIRPQEYLPNCLYASKTPYKAQGEALRAAEACGRGIISMPTGTGKSMVIAMIAAHYNVKTLIVVPTLEIKKQLTANLAEFLPDTTKIKVLNIDSKALQTAKDFDMLIIDEAHHVAAKTYQKLNKGIWAGIYYRFFLTATPFRNDTEETLLFESIAGQVIYKLNYQDAIKEGYIVPIEAYYVDVPKREVDGHTWSQVYNELVVNNNERNEAIALLALRLNNAGRSTLVLVKEVAHGDAIAKLTGLPFVHGQDEESRDYIRHFNNGGIKALIGTTGIISEGVDTKPCEYVLVCGLGKAKSAFMQAVGRAVRTYPGKESAKVILFRDTSHKWPLQHYREQAKILLQEYGVKPQKLEIE